MTLLMLWFSLLSFLLTVQAMSDTSFMVMMARPHASHVCASLIAQAELEMFHHSSRFGSSLLLLRHFVLPVCTNRFDVRISSSDPDLRQHGQTITASLEHGSQSLSSKLVEGSVPTAALQPQARGCHDSHA